MSPPTIIVSSSQLLVPILVTDGNSVLDKAGKAGMRRALADLVDRLRKATRNDVPYVLQLLRRQASDLAQVFVVRLSTTLKLRPPIPLSDLRRPFGHAGRQYVACSSHHDNCLLMLLPTPPPHTLGRIESDNRLRSHTKAASV